MQNVRYKTRMWACVAALVVATLSLGVVELRPAQAQQLIEMALVVPILAVDRIEDAAGNNLGSGIVQANIRVGADGSAQGDSSVVLADSRAEFFYERGRVFYDEAGQFSRLELAGHGTVSDSVGKQKFTFTAGVSVKAGDPDLLLFDILGSDTPSPISDGVQFVVNGKVKVVRASLR